MSCSVRNADNRPYRRSLNPFVTGVGLSVDAMSSRMVAEDPPGAAVAEPSRRVCGLLMGQGGGYIDDYAGVRVAGTVLAGGMGETGSSRYGGWGEPRGGQRARGRGGA